MKWFASLEDSLINIYHHLTSSMSSCGIIIFNPAFWIFLTCAPLKACRMEPLFPYKVWRPRIRGCTIFWGQPCNQKKPPNNYPATSCNIGPPSKNSKSCLKNPWYFHHPALIWGTVKSWQSIHGRKHWCLANGRRNWQCPLPFHMEHSQNKWERGNPPRTVNLGMEGGVNHGCNPLFLWNMCE